MNMNKVLNVAADGYADDSGRGSWAVYCSNFNYVRTGSNSDTSNARMELLAMCEALDYVLDGINKFAVIKSHSNYIVSGINRHLDKWTASRFEGLKNRDLWILLSLKIKRLGTEGREVEFVWFNNSTDESCERVKQEAMNTRERFYEIIQQKRRRR